jgi:hypothetical protein
MATSQGPLPPANIPWIDKPGTPSLAFRQYFLTLDAVVKALVGGLFGAPVQLTNAANDAAAAAAGVAIGQLYRNGSVVQIRVT